MTRRPFDELDDPRSAQPEPALSPLPMRLEQVLDWFIPDGLRGAGEEDRRARLVVVSALAITFLATVALLFIDWDLRRYDVLSWPFPLPRGEVVSLIMTMLIGVSVAYTVRRTGTARSASWLLSASMFVLLMHFAISAGGFWSSAMWWLCIVPLLSAFLGGPRVMAGATVASVALLWLLYEGDRQGIIPPQPVHEIDASRDMLFRARFTFLALAAFLGWYYEQLGSRVARRMESANQRLEASNDELRVSRLHLRQIAENIGQAIWMEEPAEGRLLYANPAFAKLYGVSVDRLREDLDAWQRVIHPADTKLIPDQPDGEDHLYRVQREHVDRWVRHACWRAEGSTKRIIHIAADATLKRHAEALRMRFLEAVLDVQENERRHLARELHDETGQALTALLVGLRAIRTGLDSRKQAHIDILSSQLRHVVTDLSRLARGLHPSVLDELGLSAGIERLAQDLRAAHGIHVEYRHEGVDHEDALAPQERLTVYRIVQEALTNVARHARARRADVTLRITADRVDLRVEDDGRGFDLDEVTGPSGEIGTGLGLYGMRERAQLLGGSVDIESARDRGTTILGWIPRGHRAGRGASLAV